jgi:hypothetical protein
VARLRVGEGDTLLLTETPDGFALTPYDEAFAAGLSAFEHARRDLRNALRVLARGESRRAPGRRS